MVWVTPWNKLMQVLWGHSRGGGEEGRRVLTAKHGGTTGGEAVTVGLLPSQSWSWSKCSGGGGGVYM